MFQETLISASCNLMDRHRNKYTSSSILGLHSRVTEGMTNELDIRIGKAIAIMKALHYSVVVRRELSKKS